MSPHDDETLMRRIDGELTAEESERIDRAAAVDPGLAARLEGMRRLRAAAREAFPIAVDARDQSLARMIAAAPVKRGPLTGVGQWLADAFAPRPAALWGGLATAAFVAGLMLGPLLDNRNGIKISADGVLVDAALVKVMDTRLAADGPDGGGRSVGLSFRNSEGRWCRTFQAEDARLAGLACRERNDWAVRVLAQMGPAGGDIRAAGADLPDAVLSAIDAMIEGQTLDASAEARARNAGWR